MARKKHKRKRFTKRQKQILWLALAVFILIYIGVILYHTYKPLPKGISYEGDVHRTDDIEIFTDLTYSKDKKKENMKHDLNIFDEVYAIIDSAEEFIVLDFFLMDHYSDEKLDFPKIAETITEKLIRKKKENPEMPIVFVTDPINNGYGSYESKWFKKLKDAGIDVVYTELDPLRDSMPLYSGLYRTLFRWGDIGGKGWIPNAMASEAPKFRLASYVKLLNVKANHRKMIATEKSGLVTSSNPHDASGFHGNVAFKVSGPIINDLIEAEEAVVNYSTGKTGQTLPRIDDEEPADGEYAIQYVTEKKIKSVLLDDLAAAQKGDRVRMGMFFIAEPAVVKAITEAAKRGVEVQLILDPNENSFGNQKSGLPNRPVVQKLVEDSNEDVEVRWYNTVAGQYHTKLVMIERGDSVYVLNGSANLTERTLDNYNLENDLYVIAPVDSGFAKELDAYFNRLWTNEDALFTLDLEEYQDTFTRPQRVIYALQEWLKLTSY
ncbi:phospholipase D family protein [Sporosarcina aquimarina]|uniref:Phospholipase D family protein n=1 Tax=Sporosarcina aquimarina TaxID=114975 RepID=A0ABU4FWT8_9BACL|nr:phospholipase D family protein [Sporosarcina aquimarina]MDW0108563.1 phospholipase D family protein [Sporosarcina aquimarina]